MRMEGLWLLGEVWFDVLSFGISRTGNLTDGVIWFREPDEMHVEVPPSQPCGQFPGSVGGGEGGGFGGGYDGAGRGIEDGGE